MEKEIINTIHINTSREKLWDALINPEKTKVYMFGCKAVSDWNPGSELLWQADIEGKPMVFVKGRIISIEPLKKLTYSVFDPNSTMEDVHENYLHVTYILEDEGAVQKLTVIQGDYTQVAEGERRYQEAYNNGQGWNPILQQIKELLES